MVSKAKSRKQGAEGLGAQQLTRAAQLVLTVVTGNILSRVCFNRETWTSIPALGSFKCCSRSLCTKKFKRGDVALSSNDGLPLMFSSFSEESSCYTASAFPPCVSLAASRQRLKSRDWYRARATVSGNNGHSSKYMKAGSTFITSLSVFPATYIRFLPFFYLSLVTSALKGNRASISQSWGAAATLVLKKVLDSASLAPVTENTACSCKIVVWFCLCSKDDLREVTISC